MVHIKVITDNVPLLGGEYMCRCTLASSDEICSNQQTTLVHRETKANA